MLQVMTDLILYKETMSSLEIAELTGKRHDAILRDIRNLLNQGVNAHNFGLSGNFWLVSFKISYLCLPLFYETRTTPSCHPSGCAYRQL